MTSLPQALFGVLALLVAPWPAAPASAQPAPSFRVSCSGLRSAVLKLAPKDDELVTIQVEGRLTAVHSDGALVYLLLCAAPDPQVMCVTYAENGRKVGDSVVVSGSYGRVGPNHVKLDPCLHHLPGADDETEPAPPAP